MSNTENTALTLSQNNFSIVPIAEELRDVIAEEMDGLGTIPFDVIKIPSGGGIAFDLPGDDDNPQVATEIVGIIVDHHPVNGYWEGDFDGSNNPPLCASFDGKTATFYESGEIRSCANCPLNQFGSAAKGKGKACKNMHRLYILRDGETLPIMFNLPPSSIAGWRDYLGKKIVIKGKNSWMVLTKISLKKEKSADGIPYSRAVFTKVGDLTVDECVKIKSTVEGIKLMTRSQAMQTVDTIVSAEPEAARAGYTDVTDNDNPFA